jgi:hypothetical protein
MSTQITYLTGIGKWVKPYPGQEDTKFGKKAVMDLYLDQQGLMNYQASGSRIKLRDDEEGTFIKLTRNVDQVINDKPLGHPVVIMKDDNGDYQPFDRLIGNGSKVVAKITTFDTKFGRGTRWEALEVVDHVAYEGATVIGNEGGLYKF